MRKKYVISINNSTKDQEQAFVRYIQDKNWAWWHRLTNTWLIVDARGNSSAASIRTDLKEIFANEYSLVIEINGNIDTWAGFGSTRDGKSMFEWLKRNWKT
ncbi:hypothetical protein ACFE6N_12165 [Pedobacter sp. BG31]|uniref:hypothetical protein n=1 Tax=Pedobacter sp. BG31 TaxID=3349697 RepID=UPI0035F4E8BA